MNLVDARKKGTTRRGFVKTVAAGAGGVALANSLQASFRSGQRDLIAAPAPKSKYDKFILAPEIKRDLKNYMKRFRAGEIKRYK